MKVLDAVDFEKVEDQLRRGTASVGGVIVDLDHADSHADNHQDDHTDNTLLV